jgi:hypothetical protein
LYSGRRPALWRTPREIIGKPSDILIPPDRRSDESAILRRVLAGDMVQGYLTTRLRRDGTFGAREFGRPR